MTGPGPLTYAPNRRLRLLLAVHVTWVALVCLLGAWWERVIFRQATRISELSRALGQAAETTEAEWLRTQRMLFGESWVFFGLLLGTTALLVWLYWRDVLRGRGLEAFFGSVTHELKTPLTSIRLQAEAIAEDGASPEVVRRLLEDTVRLEGQVERTLELARVEGGGRVFTQTFYLKPWLDQFVHSSRSAYADTVHFDLKSEDVAVEADAGAMQIILKNLVENSLRHTKRRPVRVSVATAGAHGAGKIELRVRDDGPGFVGSVSGLGRIFIKGPGSPGAGVGLYLVKVLMERMGGRAEFVGGEGFEVRLCFREGRSGG